MNMIAAIKSARRWVEPMPIDSSRSPGGLASVSATVAIGVARKDAIAAARKPTLPRCIHEAAVRLSGSSAASSPNIRQTHQTA